MQIGVPSNHYREKERGAALEDGRVEGTLRQTNPAEHAARSPYEALKPKPSTGVMREVVLVRMKQPPEIAMCREMKKLA